MIRTIAIASLAIRAAIRSRLFLTLMIVLLLVVIGLPLTIKGDGTVAGQVKVLLYYTVGFAAIILGTATLWNSCAAISREIEEKQIQTLVTKPVHRFQIWIGKWIGLLVVNAILLSLTGIVVYAYVRYDTSPSRLAEKDRDVLHRELLVGRRLILPETAKSVDKEVRERLTKLRRDGKVPAGVSDDDACAEIRRSLVVEMSIIAPGQSKQWIFDVPSSPNNLWNRYVGTQGFQGDSTATIRFHFTSTVRDRKSVSGTWTVAKKNGPTTFSFDITNRYDGVHAFSVPGSAISSGGIVVTFKNGNRDISNTALFDSDLPVEILVKESSFGPNLIRALAVILCHLGLIAAIGLTAGSLFSFPVATFTAMAILSISLAGHYFTMASSPKNAVHDSDEPEPEVTVLQTVSENVIKRLEVVIAPALELTPLGPLSDGILVSWAFTGKAILLLLIVYPAFFGLFGSYFLDRRELALPAT
jgi:hypothetical protein